MTSSDTFDLNAGFFVSVTIPSHKGNDVKIETYFKHLNPVSSVYDHGNPRPLHLPWIKTSARNKTNFDLIAKEDNMR